MPYAKGTRKMFVGMPLLLVPSLPVARLQTFQKSERLMFVSDNKNPIVRFGSTQCFRKWRLLYIWHIVLRYISKHEVRAVT